MLVLLTLLSCSDARADEDSGSYSGGAGGSLVRSSGVLDCPASPDELEVAVPAGALWMVYEGGRNMGAFNKSRWIDGAVFVRCDNDNDTFEVRWVAP